MSRGIVLRPGDPDDDNRAYLPEELKGSSVVVNENGNNSQPYPQRLTKHTGVVGGDIEGTWYEYVPESYTPDAPAPLVISLHGGLMTGWAQAVYTSWTNVADREGFVVAFPDANSRRLWVVDVPQAQLDVATTPDPNGFALHRPPADIRDNPDIRFLLGLVEQLSERYNIDQQRIFMQGMSMGDMMTSQFARHFGQLLAGAAGSGGPADPALLFTPDNEIINDGGPVPIWQSRLELDEPPARHTSSDADVVTQNREYWLRVNGVTEHPQIAVRGASNIAFYRGARGDVVFRDVFNRDHGQTFDDAELVWSHLFSGCRRLDDGTLERTTPLLPRIGDAFAIAIGRDQRNAWVSGRILPMGQPAFAWGALKYHGLDGGSIRRGRSLYVPVSFLASAFGATVTTSPGGVTAAVALPDGRTAEFARGLVACVLDGRVTSMPAEAVMRGGELCISLEWFAASILNLHTSRRAGLLYVTDHHARLSRNMARLILDLLE